MPIFPQNVIAVIWDFDKTLIPGYMQKPLFDHFDIDPVQFCTESDGLARYYEGRGPNARTGTRSTGSSATDPTPWPIGWGRRPVISATTDPWRHPPSARPCEGRRIKLGRPRHRFSAVGASGDAVSRLGQTVTREKVMEIADIDGIEIAYEQVGSGPPLLLLTGLGGVGRAWGSQFLAEARILL